MGRGYKILWTALWILQLFSGHPGASSSAKLDLIFLLLRLSCVMNGPLGDPEHVGRDLKNVFLEKNQDGVAFAVRPNPDDHQASRIYMSVHSVGLEGGRGGMLSIL